jgi:hypothetical protein
MPRRKIVLDAEQKVKPVLVRMSHGLYLRLKTQALREDRTATKIILTALNEYLKGKNA